MRIAIVGYTDFTNPGAAVRRVYLIARGLAELGHEVHAVVPQRYGVGPLTADMDNVHVHWGIVAGLARHRNLKVLARARLAAWSIIRRLASDRKLDWLLLYNLGLEGVVLGAAVKAWGGRVATEYCDLRSTAAEPRVFERLRHASYLLADQLTPRLAQLNIVISRYLDKRMESIAPGVPRLIIPPLVDCERFQNDPPQGQTFRQHWQLGKSPIVAYLGTYWHVEGVAVLLRAARSLADAGLAFKLVISGRPPTSGDFDDVPRLVRDWGLGGHVVMTGWLATDQVIAAMSAAEVLVLPKLNHVINIAGYPTKLAEYLSMGKAVVASSVGDIPDHIRHDRDALLCTPGDQVELAQAIQRVLQDGVLRGTLGKNARQCAIRCYNYQVAAPRIEQAML